LNEVFAEYFLNDYDDPLNAYTGGMANYGATVALPQNNYNPSGVMASTGSSKTVLPTGGIRTAFHTGVVAPAPVSKKAKVEDNVIQNSTQQNDKQQQDSQKQQILPGVEQNQSLFPQFQLPNTGIAPQLHQTTQIANVALTGGIALPVGVGIRLGGIGGVVPASAHTRFAQPGSYPAGGPYSQGMMWNNNLDPSEEGMSEEAITERRQRNREHAKRSRVRKKFMLESMQEEVRELQRENHRLRMLVQEQIPEHAMQIISECCTHNPLFGDSSTNDESNIPSSMAGGETTGSLERSDFSLMQSLAAGQKCFVLSDPKLPDNPIVFATSDFYKLTGYTSQEVLGRNCRFLQGPGTDKRAVDVIRKAVATGSDATVCLINYKADGTPFWNQFFIAALRDSDNNIVNFVSNIRHCWCISTYAVFLHNMFTLFIVASNRLVYKPKSNQKLRLYHR
jgi:PAS domain S-box-containing protein